MENFSDKKTFVSEYNEAGYQIARLNSLWTLSNNYARSGQLEKWKWILDRIWVELSADAKKKDETKYFKEVKRLNLIIGKAKISSELYNALQDKEIFLRSLQEDVGKGGKRKEQFDEDW